MFGYTAFGAFSFGEMPGNYTVPESPGGGLATKTQAQLMYALSKTIEAMYQVHQLAQSGIPVADTRTASADAAVAIAIAALVALQ